MDDFQDVIAPDLEDFIETIAVPSVTPSVPITDGWSVVPSAVDSGVTDRVDHEVCAGVTTDMQYVDNSTFDRMLIDAHLTNVHSALPKFCWEEGVLGDIFSGSSSSLPSMLNVVLPQPDDSNVTVPSTAAVGTGILKRKFDGSFYASSVKVISDKDYIEQQQQLWASALCKWESIFCIVDYQGPIGETISNAANSIDGVLHPHEILRDVFGVKSPRTVLKRASALLAFFRWLQTRGQSMWPFRNDQVAVYMGDFMPSKKGHTRGSSFLQACRFAHHVLLIDMSAVLGDTILTGRAARLEAMKATTVRARILSVKEVQRLENFLFEDHELYDQYLVGCCLFAIYSRSRWSDLSYLSSLTLDTADTPDGLYGYLEGATVHQKTATTALKQSMEMPLVAPIQGVTMRPWAIRFCEILQLCEIDMDATPFGALCRAPLRDGDLSERPLETSEINGFLCNVLGLEQDKRASSHSLKATTLSWSSRFGLEEDARVLLGHHEHPSKPLAVYSRDMLSRPLKLYESMLLSVRMGAFQPDTSRSGWTSTRVPAKDVIKIEDSDNEEFNLEAGLSEVQDVPPVMLRHEDLFDGEVATPAQCIDTCEDEWDQMEKEYGGGARASHVESLHGSDDVDVIPQSSSSDDSSDSDSSSVHEELMVRMHCESSAVLANDLDEPCYQHKRSKVLHLPNEEKSTFLCGRRIADSYVFLQHGASFKWPRCSGCFRGQVITTPGGLADAFDMARQSRLARQL